MCKIHCEAGVFLWPLFFFCLVRVVQWCQRELFYLLHLECRIWRIQHGSKSLVHMSMVTEYSLSWLSRVRGGSGLIYGDMQSGEKLAMRAWSWGCLVCAEAFWAHKLSSAGWTRVGSPDVRSPAHLHRVGVRVDLREGAQRNRDACLQTADGVLNKNKVWRNGQIK